MKKTWQWLALAAVAVLSLVAARLVWAGSAYYTRAASVEQGDAQQAVLWYGEAVRAYLPFYHPKTEAALAALERMARSAEQRGDLRLALFVWDEMHAALNAVRSFYQPWPELLEKSRAERQRVTELLASRNAGAAPVPPAGPAPPSPEP